MGPLRPLSTDTTGGMRCTEWRTYRRNTLLGFATLQQASGLIISDASLHGKNGKSWVSPPAKPKIDGNGVALRNRETGKVDYVPVVGFASDQLRRNWSDQAVAAIRRDHPEAFEPALDSGTS